jgi:small redox-active disulfide protein 2
MLTIKVLGSGCESCKKVEVLAHRAVEDLGIEAEILKVTDQSEIYRYPILGTPGLVIDEKVVCAGRIPSQAEVISWITSSLN